MCDKISVIIPVYNSCDTIANTIDSVLNQDYRNIEIIVVNDGSTDGLFELLSNNYIDNIKLITTVNRGVSSARNTGINNSTGNYIAFLDSDDIWAPDKLSKQIKLIESCSDYCVCYTDRYLINMNSEILITKNRKHHTGDILNKIIVSNFICLSSVIIKKECFETCGYFDENLTVSEDYDLWIRISSRYKFIYLDEKLVYYRITTGSLTKDRKRMLNNAFNVFSKNICNYEILSKVKLLTIIRFYSDTYKSLGLYYYDSANYAVSLKLFMFSVLLYPFYFESYTMFIKSFVNLIFKR